MTGPFSAARENPVAPGRSILSAQNVIMTPAEAMSYTAKFIDGPLQGRTRRVDFLAAGDPAPRLEVAADAGEQPSTRFVYVRGSVLEFDEGQPDRERPSAVEYRYLEVLTD